MKTVDERVLEFGDVVRQRLAPSFAAAGVPYPPARIALLAIKQRRVLEVYAAGPDETMSFVCRYPILAASGSLGPKLREGDRQVPEGVYQLRELNPNSLFHLSLWIDYPNAFDLAHAAAEGRTEPGSEIMIHGGAESRGCVAVGDTAAEDLFVLAAVTGVPNVRIILTPVDFRIQTAPVDLPAEAPRWTPELYEILRLELSSYRSPRQTR